MLAKDYDDFTEKAMTSVQAFLNSKDGQVLTNDLLQAKLKENPNLTREEWSKCKQEFMVFCFYEALKNNPALWDEFATHTYNMLREN